jgi:hypothetical protein
VGGLAGHVLSGKANPDLQRSADRNAVAAFFTGAGRLARSRSIFAGAWGGLTRGISRSATGTSALPAVVVVSVYEALQSAIARDIVHEGEQQAKRLDYPTSEREFSTFSE